jgi:hypothetical protein
VARRSGCFYVFNPEGHLGVGSYYEDPNDPVVAGQWMHFTGVADNGAVTIYKNGIDTGHCFQYQGDGPCRQQFDAAGNRIVIDPVAASAPLRIGTQDGTSYFQGSIAALRIWNRALTNTEVGDLYQSDQFPPDGLVAQYLLDEGSGTVAFDTSGGAFPGGGGEVDRCRTWGAAVPPAVVQQHSEHVTYVTPRRPSSALNSFHRSAAAPPCARGQVLRTRQEPTMRSSFSSP